MSSPSKWGRLREVTQRERGTAGIVTGAGPMRACRVEDFVKTGPHGDNSLVRCLAPRLTCKCNAFFKKVALTADVDEESRISLYSYKLFIILI